MKIKYAKPEINPFGGNILINYLLNQNNLSHLLDNYLGERSTKATYNYSDFLKALWSVYFSGRDAIEDMHTHLKPYVNDWFNGKAPSSDSVLKFMQAQSSENTVYESDQNIAYCFNANERLNRLNIQVLKHLKLVGQNQGDDHVIDYDNVPLEHDKKDKKAIYKGGKGYHPGVVTIDGYPAFVENREGNAHPKFRQQETLSHCFRLLNEEGIACRYFRGDEASYQKSVIQEVEANGMLFYIRAGKSEGLQTKFTALTGWKRIGDEDSIYEINELTHQLTGLNKTYRMIVTRVLRSDHQQDIFTGDPYIYRGIITNDWESSAEAIFHYYNKRAGVIEQRFAELHEFGWSNLPFSWLHENTVFMIFTALGYNVFCFLKQMLSRKVNFVDVRGRLKRFIFDFVVVPAKWIKQGRQWILKLFTEKPYHLALE